MASKALDTYLHGVRAGSLARDDVGDLSFTYDKDYLGLDDSHALSISLPLREEPFTDDEARPYFSGLLPDSGRKRFERVLHVSEGNIFGLLEAIGGECAGAVSFIKAGEPFPTGEEGGIRPLSDHALEDAIEGLAIAPLLSHMRDLRYTLAGVQDKFPACVINDRIALPFSGVPSTHILKAASSYVSGSVANEFYCMRLARMAGLTNDGVVHSRIGKQDYYVIERYDRVLGSDGRVTRIHQEDLCQALGMMPDKKYEAMGGPSIAEYLNVIKQHSKVPAKDILVFIRMLTFNYLVGNADAHGKNYSLLYRDDMPSLAPIYDVLCIAVWREFTTKLSMSIGGEYDPSKIGVSHWRDMASQCELDPGYVVEELGQMATAVRKHSEGLSKEMVEANLWHPIMAEIRKVIDNRSKHVLIQLER